MPEPTPPTTDRTLAGRYRLLAPIARGGMAEVWEGHDDVLDRRVAVKLLHPHLAEDPGFAERFRREAIAAARLTHPNIVSTFDAGTDGTDAYIVMELVRGRTLRQALEAGPLTPATAVRIAADVADALHHAHRAGIIHRDVKPANILLCEDEDRLARVKVADFGIAKLQSGGADLTQTGAIVGTAKYLSPEQVEGRSPDVRSDIYALGVVLYEMLCGRPPFAADTELATALQHVQATPPPPRQLREGLPPALEQLVLKAMAKDAADRHQSAHELRVALLALDGDDAAPSVVRDRTPPEGVRPLPRPARRSWFPAVVVAGMAAAVLGVLTVVLSDRPSGQGPADPRDAPAGPPQPLPIAAARSFDPQGGGAENENRVRFVFDGSPRTLWPTDTYRSRQFGNLKDGVGLWVQVPAGRSLRRLDVSSPTRGWAAQVYVAARPGGSLAEWGRPVDTRDEIDGDISFDLRGRRGTHILLWITDPGRGNRTEIREMAVLG